MSRHQPCSPGSPEMEALWPLTHVGRKPCLLGGRASVLAAPGVPEASVLLGSLEPCFLREKARRRFDFFLCGFTLGVGVEFSPASSASWT